MNTLVEILPGLLRRLTLYMPAQQVKQSYDRYLTQVIKSSNLKIDGFRPNKISPHAVHQRYGNKLYSQFIQEFVGKQLEQAIVQEKLNLIYKPIVTTEKTKLGEDLEIIAEFEVFPEINLREPQNQLANFVLDIQPSDLQNLVTNLLKKHATWHQVERPAQIGDHIIIKLIDLNSNHEQELSTFIGSELLTSISPKLEKLEQELIGLTIGENKVLDNYDNYKVEIINIEEAKIPVLDDQLAIKMGFKEGVSSVSEELKNILTNLTTESLKQIKNWRILDHFLELNQELILPKKLLEFEEELMKNNYKQTGMDLNEEQKDKINKLAQQRVKLMLLVNKYITNYDIKLDLAKLDKLIPNFSQIVNSPNLNPAQEHYLNQAKIQVMIEQLIEHLEPKSFNATLEEKKSYQEITDLYQKFIERWQI